MSYIDKFTSVTFLISLAIFNILGYVFGIEELMLVLVKPNGGGAIISFIPLISSILLSYTIYYFTKNIDKENNK